MLCALSNIADMLHMLLYARRYALVHCAIYGTSLPAAGKETRALFARRGWGAIINDSLTENVLTLGCVVVGVLCALAGIGIAALVGMSGMLTAVLATFGLFMGFNLAAIAMSVVRCDHSPHNNGLPCMICMFWLCSHVLVQLL